MSKILSRESNELAFVEKLVNTYNSPLYIYELSDIDKAYRDLSTNLPNESHIYYSLKANPHPVIVERLHALGCHLEISSTGELDVVLAAGLAADRCLFTGPGKTDSDIEFAIQNEVYFFSVESLNELTRINSIARRYNRKITVLVRINVDESVSGLGLTMTGVASQFGVDYSWFYDNYEEFYQFDWVNVVGFHYYIGTNIESIDTLVETFDLAIYVANELSENLGIRIQLLDLGGGFGHPYATSSKRPYLQGLKRRLEETLGKNFAKWRDGETQIVFESGRYLVAHSGTLYCTVVDVKISKGEYFVILDSGINHLGGMCGLRRVPRIVPTVIKVSPLCDSENTCKVNIVGPLCTPLDCWARGIELSECKPGDLLAIPNVGAYGLTGSLIAFLSHMCPIEVVVRNGVVLDVSQIVVKRNSLWRAKNWITQ